MHDLWTAVVQKWPEILVGLIIFAVTSGYNWLKKWFQQGSPRERQVVLTSEAGHLLKLHETLAKASEPSAKVTKAQTAITDQLNQVVENLAHLLTEPEAAATHSPFWATAGKYLLLNRATGSVSQVMHWIFYLLVLLWGLITYIALTSQSTGGANDSTNWIMCLFLLTPVALWNYFTRKVDAWMRKRHASVPIATISK
jgi:hypothetical protein